MVDKQQEVDRSAVTDLSAALERLVQEDKVDETALKEIDKVVSSLNDKTKAAIMDLPIIQTLVQSAKVDDSVPGSVIQQGIFSRKVPYSKNQVYEKWGVEESFTAPETIPVITPGGWVFRLREGVTYDIPRGTPAEQIPEDHGYQLPKIVISILRDRAAALRQKRRETEERPFGQGVTFLQTGWAGKAQEIAAADAGRHPEPTTE